MLATGYWIILARQKEILLQLQLHDMHRNSDQQNKQLKTLLIEKETTRKKLELEYLLRQKLVSHVGHDLRQPITAASYMLRQLQKTAPPESDSTLISDTSECISSASRMIEDIVQYTHFNNYEIDVIPTQSSLHDIMIQIAREYATQAENASCQIRCSYTSLIITIDIDLLKRVLRNLVTNVIKHSDASQTLLGVRRRKIGIEIWVVDNGRGIDDKTVDSELFVSTQSKDGLGLGLSISRQLVVACGGRLNINTKNGEGTIVKIAIPNHMVFSQSKISHSTINPSTASV
jgi:signal transduction histidine kinase